MANYLVSGGSGFVGTHLCKLLHAQGHLVYVLTTSQKPRTAVEGIQFIFWNPKESIIDTSFQLHDCYVINLAGAGVVEKRWRNDRKKELIASRVDSLNTLFKAIEKKQISVKHLVSASAIGYYGNGDKFFSEEDKGDDSFLSSVCQQWEAAALQFEKLNIPVAIARIGIVFGNEAGALCEFLKPLHFGFAGIPADGNQIYSWIHVDDVSRLLYFLSSHNHRVIVNAVAPNPATVNDIFNELIKYTKPFFFSVHAPQFLLKILMGEMAIEVLKSTRVQSAKIQSLGFSFLHETIASCVKSLRVKH